MLLKKTQEVSCHTVCGMIDELFLHRLREEEKSHG